MIEDGVSVRAYARARGVSHTAIQKAIRAGRLKPLANGRIDPETADAQLASQTDFSKQRNPSIDFGDRSAEAPPGAGVSADPTAAGKYATSRAARESYLAALAGLKYREQLGKLIPVDEVRSTAFQAARRARDLFRGLPDRMAAILAGTVETEECHRLLREEVEKICAQIRDNPFEPENAPPAAAPERVEVDGESS